MSDNTSLPELKARYSSALYAFFRITNLQEQWELFKTQPTVAPQFQYIDIVNTEFIETRLASLKKELKQVASNDDAAIDFLEWRITETEVLLLFLQLRQRKDEVPEAAVQDYIHRQEALYGTLDISIFHGIISSLETIAAESQDDVQEAFQSVVKQIGGYQQVRLDAPTPPVFKHYREVCQSATAELQKLADDNYATSYTSEQLVDIYNQALDIVGAKAGGWTARISNGGTNILISKYRKQVLIGSDYVPRSFLGFKQVLLHEIACHVQRSFAEPRQVEAAGINEHEEGLAVVLEQLVSHHFHHKRTMRYLAVALAVGIDGQVRSFVEVYEILWRVAYIFCKDQESAKKRAFYETSRVFRGGIPAIRGMAYIKDKVYLESNMQVWKLLESPLLDENAFASLLRPTYDVANKGKIL